MWKINLRVLRVEDNRLATLPSYHIEITSLWIFCINNEISDKKNKKTEEQSPAAVAEIPISPEVEALIQKIGLQGDKVRELKTGSNDKVLTDFSIYLV